MSSGFTFRAQNRGKISCVRVVSPPSNITVALVHISSMPLLGDMGSLPLQQVEDYVLQQMAVFTGAWP